MPLQLQDSRWKPRNQTIWLPFCTHSTGSVAVSVTARIQYFRFTPSVTFPCQILVPNTCPMPCTFIHHLDNSVRPVTTAFFVYPLSEQSPVVKELDPSHMLVLWCGTDFCTTSGPQSQNLHSSRPLKPISLPPTTEFQCSIPLPLATHVAARVTPHSSHLFFSLCYYLQCTIVECLCMLFVVVVLLLLVLLWSASSPNKMGRSRSLLYYY